MHIAGSSITLKAASHFVSLQLVMVRAVECVALYDETSQLVARQAL